MLYNLAALVSLISGRPDEWTCLRAETFVQKRKVPNLRLGVGGNERCENKK